jgi:hypothetical protein
VTDRQDQTVQEEATARALREDHSEETVRREEATASTQKEEATVTVHREEHQEERITATSVTRKRAESAR